MSNDRLVAPSSVNAHFQVALSVAFEEAAIEVLSEGAHLLRSQGREAAAQQHEDQIRRHRVGLIKHRAIMAAHGIKV